MVVIVFAALLGTPLADISAEPAVLRLKLALAHDGMRTKGADIDTFPAALWTVIMRLLAEHLGEAGLAVLGTFLTGFDTIEGLSRHCLLLLTGSISRASVGLTSQASLCDLSVR